MRIGIVGADLLEIRREVRRTGAGLAVVDSPPQITWAVGVDGVCRRVIAHKRDRGHRAGQAEPLKFVLGCPLEIAGLCDHVWQRVFRRGANAGHRYRDVGGGVGVADSDRRANLLAGICGNVEFREVRFGRLPQRLVHRVELGHAVVGGVQLILQILELCTVTAVGRQPVIARLQVIDVVLEFGAFVAQLCLVRIAFPLSRGKLPAGRWADRHRRE